MAAFVLIVVASGGTAGAASAFAANVRTSPQTAIVAQAAPRTISIVNDKIKITPMKDGVPSGSALYIDTANLSVEAQQLKGSHRWTTPRKSTGSRS